MLSQTAFEEFANQFHTSELNIMREYLQNLLLSHLYQHPRSNQLAFKGGTALRLLFGSPRFSEDLDFNCGLTEYHVKTILNETHERIKKEAIPSISLENKPTSGGYFAIYRFEIHGQQIDIEWNLSLRKAVQTELLMVTTPLMPSYQCMALPIDALVKEKMEALLRRKKPRDFFDLYFFLRSRRGLKNIIPLKKMLLKEIGQLETGAMKFELKHLLPGSLHSLLKNFPAMVAKELERASPAR